MPAKNGNSETAVFIECVMEAVGVSTPSALADRLVDERLFRYSEGRKVHKWASGESAPNFRSTMRLLQRAGFLTPEALACLRQGR